MIRIAIVEDDREFREFVAFLINSTDGFSAKENYDSIETLIYGLNSKKCDVILMDIKLPGKNGIEGCRLIKDIYPDIDIIMLTVQNDDDSIFMSLESGATGYILKDDNPCSIIASINEVINGGAPMSSSIAKRVIKTFRKKKVDILTKRELEVLKKLCDGESYQKIADQLFVSRETVHHHIKSIYKKLQVSSKSQAVSKALRERIV